MRPGTPCNSGTQKLLSRLAPSTEPAEATYSPERALVAIKDDGVIGLFAEWAGVARPSHWWVPPLGVRPLLDALVAELVEARVQESLLRQSARKAWAFPTLLVV